MKLVAGMTNLVENSPFSLIALWSLIRSLGDGIALVASDCLTNSSSFICIFNKIYLSLYSGLFPNGCFWGSLRTLDRVALFFSFQDTEVIRIMQVENISRLQNSRFSFTLLCV